MSFLFQRKATESQQSSDAQPMSGVSNVPSPSPQPTNGNGNGNAPLSPSRQPQQSLLSSIFSSNTAAAATHNSSTATQSVTHVNDDSSRSNSHSSSGQQMPTFHSADSFTPSSRGGHMQLGSLSGSNSFAGPIHRSTEDESLSLTPPNDRSELIRSSSSGAPTSAAITITAPSAKQSNSGLLLGTNVTSSGSLHNIYQTNIVMTPTPSHPSTPLQQPMAWDLAQHHKVGSASPHAKAVPLVYPNSLSSSGSILAPAAAAPAAAPVSSPQASRQQMSPIAKQPSPPADPMQSSPTPVVVPSSSASSADSSVPDEVLMTRRMFLKLPSLQRNIFQLGDTLGTGTFGRVRIVSFMPQQADPNTTETKPRYFALKMLKKSEIIRLKQVEHIKAEKAILSRINHPFIVNLYASFQDDRYVYMTMEYVIGGELFSQLRKVGRFSSETSKFYACEIILALQYLHSLNIAYRDLKPENLLIDSEGHVRMTDFGFAKVVEDRTWTLCGTPEYLAPEIIQSKGHGKAVDWWALGILIFEMLAGYPPFYDENPFGIYQKILKGSIDFPKHMDPLAKDLIRKLLTADRTKRFGCLQHAAEDIKQHPWFRNIDWNKVYLRAYKPPFVPAFRSASDTTNFDKYPDSKEKVVPPLTQKEQDLFQEFS